jgi:peptidoglycan hydrolase FlgJ
MLYVNPLVGGDLGKTAAAPSSPQRDKKVLQEFERLFLFQMLREMRKTIPKSTLFQEDSQKDFYDEMMDDTMAGQLANSGQFGLAKLMEAQIRQQERPAAVAKSTGFPLHKASAGIRLHSNDSGLPLQPASSSSKSLTMPIKDVGFPLTRKTATRSSA